MEKACTSSLGTAGADLATGFLNWFLGGAFTWAIASTAQKVEEITKVAAMRLRTVRQLWARWKRVMVDVIGRPLPFH
jgi:hypothetical protein